MRVIPKRLSLEHLDAFLDLLLLILDVPMKRQQVKESVEYWIWFDAVIKIETNYSELA